VRLILKKPSPCDDCDTCAGRAACLVRSAAPGGPTAIWEVMLPDRAGEVVYFTVKGLMFRCRAKGATWTGLKNTPEST